MTRDQIAQPGFRERIEGMTPLRRVGAPEEIAEAAAWLISPASAFVTGSVVTVSGRPLERSGVGWNSAPLSRQRRAGRSAIKARAHPQFQFPFSFAPLMFSVRYDPV